MYFALYSNYKWQQRKPRPGIAHSINEDGYAWMIPCSTAKQSKGESILIPQRDDTGLVQDTSIVMPIHHRTWIQFEKLTLLNICPDDIKQMILDWEMVHRVCTSTFCTI